MTTPARRPARTSGWVVGRVAGAPVVVSPGWLVSAVVLTFLFAPTVRRIAPGLGAGTYAVALVFVVLLFVSVFLHELAHALVARARGQRVHELAITIWGGHTAYGEASPSPATSALVAVVGPVTNLLLAGAAWAVAGALPRGALVALVLYAAAFANAFVGIFNAIPGLPLDGGRLLEAAVWAATGDRHRGTIAAGWIGRAVAVGVLAWFVVTPLLAGRQPDLVQVVWAALIGAFLWSGASRSIQGAHGGRAVEALTVAAVGRPAVAVPATASVADAEQAARAAGVGHVVLLSPDGRPAAYVDTAAAGSVPPAARAGTPAAAVAVVLPVGAVVDARLRGADLVRALAAVTRLSRVVAAVEDGQVRALVWDQDVIAALRTRA